MSSETADTLLSIGYLAALYAVPAIVTFTKARSASVCSGFWFSPSGGFGALRLAKPDSPWARRYYGPEKMARARERFAASAPPAPTAPAPAPGGALPLPPPAAPAPAPPVTVRGQAESSYGCSVCGELFADRERAIRHVASRHGELYDSPEHGLVEIGTSSG